MRADVTVDVTEACALGRPLHIVATGTLPLCVVAILSPGYVEREAADVTVPIFVGLGERDTAPDPQAEPTAYGASPDITLFICERMAQMHNFASTRKVLWGPSRWLVLRALAP